MKTNLFASLRSAGQPSSELSAAPTLASCGNNLDRYVKAMEQHFCGDMAKLNAHMEKQTAALQTALIDGSNALCDFLGIRNPDGFHTRFLSSRSSSPFIQDSDAPTALAIAATRSGKDSCVLRSLTRLDEILKKNPPGYRASHHYQQRIETALGKLLQDFHQLRTEAVKQKVVTLIEQHLLQLNPGARANIDSLARKAMARQDISDELKIRLQTLIEAGGKVKFGALLNMGVPVQQGRAGSTGRERFEAIQRKSALVRTQSETTNPATRPSNGETAPFR